MRQLDQQAAAGANAYIANSRNVAERIRSTYGREALVVNPPRGLEPSGPVEEVKGLTPGFLLTVGRQRSYKNVDAAIEAIGTRPRDQLVCVGAADGGLPSNVTAISSVSDAQLRWLYMNCRALVGLSFEDFGLTPPEAMAHGKPVALLRGGGYLETNVEGLSGVFIDDLSKGAILAGIDALDGISWDSDAIKAHGEQWSPTAFQERMRRVVAEVVAA
jgi:glycosyltransferase involved in cell wall biosynthesis